MPGRSRSKALGRLAARIERVVEGPDPLRALGTIPSPVWWIGGLLAAFYVLGRWPQIGAHVGTGVALVLRGVANGLAELWRISAAGAAGVVGEVAAGAVSIGVSAIDATHADDALALATGGYVATVDEVRHAEFRTRDEIATPRGMMVARNQAVLLGDWGSYWAILRGDVDRAVAVLTRTGQYRPDG